MSQQCYVKKKKNKNYQEITYMSRYSGMQTRQKLMGGDYWQKLPTVKEGKLPTEINNGEGEIQTETNNGGRKGSYQKKLTLVCVCVGGGTTKKLNIVEGSVWFGLVY